MNAALILRRMGKTPLQRGFWYMERRISSQYRITPKNTFHIHKNIKQPLFYNNKQVITSFMAFESTESGKNTPKKDPSAPSTIREKFKIAIAEYGSTVVVFHVGISLVSLGICYVVVSSGLDVTKFVTSLGFSSETAIKITANAGTFAIAYGVHKIFAPVRIMITLSATPFIVRYLRNIGILKHKK